MADNNGNTGDNTPVQPQPTLQLPDWFIKHHIKLLSEIQAAKGKDLLLDMFLKDSIATDDENRTPNMWHQLRDAIAAAFVNTPQGQLVSHTACILLSPANYAVVDSKFFDTTITQLAQSVRASLISLDLEDLEEIGREFWRQSQEFEDAHKDASPTQSSWDLIDDGFPAPFARHYFAPPLEKEILKSLVWCHPDPTSIRNTQLEVQSSNFRSPQTEDDTKEHRGRVVAAVLDGVTTKFTGSASNEALGKNGIATEQPVVLLQIHEDNLLSKSWSSSTQHKILIIEALLGLYELVKRRREGGQKIVILISSRSLPSAGLLLNMLRITSVSTFTIPIESSIAPSLERELAQKRHMGTLNARRFGRELMWRAANLFPQELRQSLSMWIHSEGDLFDYTLLGDSNWDADRIHKAVTQISGRAWDKKHLELEDIRLVLCQLGLLSKPHEVTHGKPKPEAQTAEERMEEIEEDLDKYEENLWGRLVNKESIDSAMEDVIIDQELKQRIDMLTYLLKTRPKTTSKALLNAFRVRGALLFGAPGTGKTLIARALAKGSGSSMLVLDGSAHISKWCGESEKYIRAAFTLATKLYPCILFIDEVDSLFSRRQSDDKSWERATINQFLLQMDGLNKDDEAPLVLVATNLPWDLDEAFLRRLPQKIFFELPNPDARFRILRGLLSDDDLDPQVDLKAIAARTDGYSGSDLRDLCNEAALSWMAEEFNAEVTTVRLTMGHFDRALDQVRPTVTESMSRKLHQFASRFKVQRRREGTGRTITQPEQTSRVTFVVPEPKAGSLF